MASDGSVTAIFDVPRSSGCKLGVLPDPRCTPGSAFNVRAEQLCITRYTQGVRYVTTPKKTLRLS
jgi:hypothetical protein